MTPRLLVTGATGFLGRSVMAALARRQNLQGGLRALARSQQAVPAWWNAEILEGDLLDPSAVERAVSGCDRILHLAGLTRALDPQQYEAVNAEGTRLLVQAARRHKVGRFVFASTRAINPAGGAYTRSKRVAERLIQVVLDDAVIVRLSELYGDHDTGGIADLTAWIQRRRWVPVIGAGRYTLAPLHVEDAAAAMLSALETGQPGMTYTVTGPERLTYMELVDRIAQSLGRQPVKLHVPVWLAAAGAAAGGRLGGRVAADQVARLVCPKPDMEPETLNRLGLTLRRFLPGSDAPASFDRFAGDYHAILSRSTQFSGEDATYFARYKLERIRRLVGSRPPAHILDVGCGVGLLTELLGRAFPSSRVTGFDLSGDSLKEAASRCARLSNVTLHPYHGNGLPSTVRGVTLAVLANVLHHLEPIRRRAFLERTVLPALAPEGRVVVFEHNPYNPLTQLVVASCPFDEDARLLSLRSSARLLRDSGLDVVERAYTTFFPRPFSALRRFEGRLSRLPLGAQYMVVAERREGYSDGRGRGHVVRV